MEMWVGSAQFSLDTVCSVMYLYPSFLKDIKWKVMSCLNWTSLCTSQESIGAYEWVFSTLFKTRGQCPPAHSVPAQFFFLNYGKNYVHAVAITFAIALPWMYLNNIFFFFLSAFVFAVKIFFSFKSFKNVSLFVRWYWIFHSWWWNSMNSWKWILEILNRFQVEIYVVHFFLNFWFSFFLFLWIYFFVFFCIWCFCLSLLFYCFNNVVVCRICR